MKFIRTRKDDVQAWFVWLKDTGVVRVGCLCVITVVLVAGLMMGCSIYF